MTHYKTARTIINTTLFAILCAGCALTLHALRVPLSLAAFTAYGLAMVAVHNYFTAD